MYNHETLEEAGYHQMKRLNNNEVVLWNEATETAELWVKSPHYAGYAVLINNVSYEFAASIPNMRYCYEHYEWEEK